MQLHRKSRKLLLHGKFPPSILLGILLNLLSLSNSFAEPANTTRLLFLGNKNIAPVVYLDHGAPAGVAVDIVRALARHLPQPVEIRAMDWPEAQALVARGEADALIQINQTEDRKKIYDFSDTILASEFSIFTRTDQIGISDISSLYGFRVGVESGGLPRQLLETKPDIRLTIIPNFLEGFKLLNKGAIDAVAVDYLVGSYIIAENRLRGIKVAGKPIAFSYSSLAVKKGNSKLLAAINKALQRIKADGTYQSIIDKWKPKEVVFQTREQISKKMHYATIVSLLVLILIAVSWMLTLKKELTKRKAAEKKLGESEARYRSLFEDAPISLWEEDFSKVKRHINDLRASGISDFRAYFAEHPEEVIRCVGAVEIIAVNQTTLKLFQADDKGHLLEGLNGIFSEESFDIFREELITLASGGTQFQSEAVQMNLHGEKFDTVVRLSIAPGYEKNWEKVFVSISDISERKQGEEDLRRLHERLALATGAARLGVWDWDIRNNHLVWDDMMYALYGLNKEDFTGAYEAWLQGLHPDDRALSDEISKLARQGQGEYDTEFRVVWPDGSIHYLKAYGQTVRDAEGKPWRMTGINFDITELKQAEEERLTHLNFLEILNQINRAIQGREDLDQMMSDVLNAVLSIFDCDRAWLFYPCDPEAPTFRVPMEITKPEYPGAKVLNVDVPLPPDMAKNLREALESAEPVTYAAGTAKPVNAMSAEQFGVQSMILVALYPKSGKPWAFGLHQCSCPRLWTPEEKRLFLEIARRLADALTALLTNRDLRESEEKYRRIVDTANEGIWVLGPDTMTTFVNARMAEMLGYSGEEMLGRPVTDFMFEEDAPEHLRNMENRRQGLSEHYERRYRHKNGQAVWALASAVPILDSGENFKGTFGMFSDITAKRQAEDELRRLNDELEQRVMQRTAELEEKNDELERMNQLFVGRELRMVELKEKIRELEEKTNKEGAES